MRLARAARLVAALLAEGQAADVSLFGLAPGALADRRTLGRGHGDAGIDFIQLLVDFTRPLVVAPVGVPAAFPA